MFIVNCCFLSTFAIGLCRFKRTTWTKYDVALICKISVGFFVEIFSLVQLNLPTVCSLHLCPCFNFFQQFSSSSRRWEKLDPTPYVRIMQLIDHKVCRSSFVCSFFRLLVRLFVRSFFRRSVHPFAWSLVLSLARSLLIQPILFSKKCWNHM